MISCIRNESTCEIRDKFLKAHKVLQDRETDLLAKLQEFEDEFVGDVITHKINPSIDNKRWTDNCSERK